MDGAIISTAPAAWIIFGRAIISTAPAELSVPLPFATPDDWGGAITSLPPVLSIIRWIYFPRINGLIFFNPGYIFSRCTLGSMDSSPGIFNGYHIILTRCAPVGIAEITRGLLDYLRTIERHSHREHRCAGIITPIGSAGVLELLGDSLKIAGALVRWNSSRHEDSLYLKLSSKSL